MTTPAGLGALPGDPTARGLATTFDEGEERRRPVLEAAARLLAEEGPHGLSLRRIAAEAGGSTQLVYTLFGGKPGLADALYAEGFSRLAAACRAALVSCPPPGDPERLMAIGRAYRAFALAEPAFFAVMFGKAIPDFTPTSATSGRCRANTFGSLVAEVQACLDAGTLVASRRSEPTKEASDGRAVVASRRSEPTKEASDGRAVVASSAEDLARLCWVTVHGLSALESAGMLRLEDPEAFVDEALRTPLLAHRP